MRELQFQLKTGPAEKRWPAAYIAGHFGVAPSTISRPLNGENGMHLKRFFEICELTGRNPIQILKNAYLGSNVKEKAPIPREEE